MIYVCIEDKTFAREIGYVFDLLFYALGLDYRLTGREELGDFTGSGNDIIVSYGASWVGPVSAATIAIGKSRFFGEEYLDSGSLPEEPVRYYGDIPVPYRGEREEGEWLSRFLDRGFVRYETKIDLIASTFFLVTGYEQHLRPERDSYGRFPAASALGCRAGFQREAVVNKYIGLLGAWLNDCDPSLELRRPWGEHEFAACLTHDVDFLEKFRRDNSWGRIFRVAFRERDPWEAGERIIARMGLEPYDTFSHILGAGRRRGLKSSFYFLADVDGGSDSAYRIDDPRTLKVLKKLRPEAEIGLHGGFESFASAERLREEKARLEAALGSPVAGIRQHYLRFELPDTWRAQAEAGFAYDTTAGFAEEDGFRFGICLPFRPYDIRAREKLDLWEVPLTVMDATLFNYRRLGTAEAFVAARRMIDKVRESRGVFVLLWHNSMLDETKIPGVRRLYDRILEYLSGCRPLALTVSEAVRMWEGKTADS